MARGIILSAQTRTTCVASLSFSTARCKIPIIYPQYLPSTSTSTCFSCTCSQAIHVRMDKYKEAFSRRMAMAGLKPHHPIALGVSGGPDSMALCVLTAGWKTGGSNGAGKSGEFIDGLLAIIVDHGLREESKEEANIVSRRVSDMDVRLFVVIGWMEGRNKVICKKQPVT